VRRVPTSSCANSSLLAFACACNAAAPPSHPQHCWWHESHQGSSVRST
jgi:hypothetical protein